MSSATDNDHKKISILEIIVSPLATIYKVKSLFLIWFIFTVIAGQIGLIIDFAIGLNTNTGSLYGFVSEYLYKNSKLGNFYIIGIAICASMLSGIFIEIISDEKVKFRVHKVYILIISLFTLFFMGIYYSVLTGPHGETSLKLSEIPNLTFDCPQLFLYILSIIISVYIFAVSKLNDFGEDFKYLEPPYYKQDDENVEQLSKAADKQNVDSKGITI